MYRKDRAGARGETGKQVDGISEETVFQGEEMDSIPHSGFDLETIVHGRQEAKVAIVCRVHRSLT